MESSRKTNPISGRLNGAGVSRTVVSGADERRGQETLAERRQRRGQETLAERRPSRSDGLWLLDLGISRTFLDKLRPTFSPWISSSTRCQHFPSSLGAFCQFELRIF